jgi:DNA polymerase-1
MMTDPWLFHPAIRDGLLGNDKIAKIGSDIKKDMHWVKNVGVDVIGEVRDTVVESWCHNENRFQHGLKEVADDYCGIKMVPFKEVFPMRKKTKYLPEESAGDAIMRVMADPEGKKRAIEYVGLDAFACWKVDEYLKTRLSTEYLREGYSYWDHFLSWETDFTRVLWNMERRGITICTGHLRAQKTPMEEAMAALVSKLAEMAGWPVNPGSPKQLGKLFFKQLGYTPIKWTKGGASAIKQPCTDEEVLAEFADNGCPFSKLIIEHRKLAKIHGTYVEGLLQWVDQELRIHTTLKQKGAVTGRLSSSDPNLQNIPRANTDKFKIRTAFVADPGYILIVADYDQLEMKLMAHFSGDPRMVDAINRGMDLHCYTVSLMFGEDYDEVFAAKKAKTPTDRQLVLQAMRQVAKAIGFGLIYGIGALKLAVQLSEELKREVTPEEAQLNIKKYFSGFQGVKAFIDDTHAQCKRTEFVQTILGVKRRLPQINARSGGSASENQKGIVAGAKRQSVNSIIQGTASNVAMAAMIRAEHDEILKALGAEMLLQVHDELIFSIIDEPERVARAKQRIKELMEDPFDGWKFNVPMTTEAKSGYTWTECK